MKRYSVLDALRCAAILGVIIIHITATSLTKAESGTLIEGVILFFNQVSRFSVPAFLFLSGLGLSLSSTNPEMRYFDFLKKRISKILLLYIGWSLVYHVVTLKTIMPLTFARNLITGGSYYHLYYVPLIIIFYLIYPILNKVGATKIGLICSAIVSIGSQVMGQISGMKFLDNLINPLNWVVFFVLGIWFSYNLDHKIELIQKHKRIILPVFVIVLLGIYIETLFIKEAIGIDPATTSMRPEIILYSCLFFLALFSSWTEEKKPQKMLKKVSDLSYGIYLSHAFVLTTVSLAYTKVGFALDSFHFLIISFFLVCSISMLASILSTRTTDRVKAIFVRAN